GASSGADLSIDWGNFSYTPNVGPDASNPAITKVPATSLGIRPELTGFAAADGSSSTVTMASKTDGTVHYVGTGTKSFGGAFINYDDFNTTPAVETINLTTAFPAGIVFALNNNGTSVTSVTFEVTDVTGKKD